jgi:outer membrane protein TolC
MKRLSFIFLLAVTMLPGQLAGGQIFPSPRYLQHLVTKRSGPTQLPGPEKLQEYVADGKLRLSLDDAVRLATLNDTGVRLNRLAVELSSLAVQRAFQPFDPVLTSTFQPRRSKSPATSELDGASTLSQLSHQGSIGYAQTFQTGTSYNIGFSTTRNASNNSFAFVNPSFASSLNFSLTQPLLRRRGLLANRAPIVIARRSLKQSAANFEAQLSDAVQTAVNRYWDVVQAREELRVLRKSLELAEETYKRDKRALELGALPPLDIYRSESQVAQRKLAAIQTEYRLKEIEDDFRRIIGADLEPAIQELPLELTEPADAPLTPVDANQALQRAYAKRPELENLRQQIANDDTTVQVANQNLKPDLNLTGFYSTNGSGGTLIDSETGGVISKGGFGDAWSQLTGFNYPTYGVTLELRLPLRNRGAEADLGTALVSKRRTLYQMRQRQQAIALEVRNAVNEMEKSHVSIAAAETALDLAKKNLAADQRKYELGTETIFFVLDAQTQLSQAEQNLVQARIGYRRATTALHKASGELLEHYNVQISD